MLLCCVLILLALWLGFVKAVFLNILFVSPIAPSTMATIVQCNGIKGSIHVLD